jgi:uncharacterized protein YndB with AHSA1/START domain
MYAFTITTDIAAPPARVWRALCDPAEVVRWDTGVTGAIDAPPDYPQPGQHVRWRYAGGRILHDRPQDVVPERALRSLITVGPVHADETYTLAPTPEGARLTTSLRVTVAWPLIGALAARVYFGPATRRSVGASMRRLRRHCEAP